MAHRRGGRQGRRSAPQLNASGSDGRWVQALQQAPNQIVIVDFRGRILYVNRCPLGVDPNHATGRTVFEFLPARAHRAFRAGIAEALAGRTMRAEVLRPDAEGRTVTYDYRFAPISEGGRVTSAVIVGVDVTAQLSLAHELSEFRQMWEGVLENAPDYIWTLDKKGVIQNINRVHPSLTRAQVVGSSVWDWFTNARDRRVFREALKDVFARGESVVVQSEFGFPEGPLSFENRLAPVRQNGAVVSAVVVSTDVTQRRRVERDFEESRLLLNSILQNAPDYIILIDREGRIRFMNRSDGVDVTGKTIYELASPESRSVMRRAVAQVFRTGKEASYEATSPGPDGGLRRWLARLGPMIEGGKVGSAILIARDVTLEKARDEELKKAQARFRGIFEHSREGMNFVDRSGRILEANPALCRMLGYARHELVGRRFSELTPEEWKPADAEAWKHILATGEPYEYEKENLRKDGSRIPITLTAFMIPDAAPEAVGAAIIRDNTDKKRLEREILQTGAREQSQLGRELHDSLGQELTGISLLAQSLARSLDGADSAHVESARRIAEAARIAVEEVRALAGGLIPAELLPNGLPAALEALRARAERLFNLKVELRCPERLERMEDVSLIHLYRIAQEAVTNAAKHAKARKVVVSLQVRRGRLELTVADDGTGLREQRAEGLGLKIMRHRALTLGGTFAARARKGGGTEIACSVPFML